MTENLFRLVVAREGGKAFPPIEFSCSVLQHFKTREKSGNNRKWSWSSQMFIFLMTVSLAFP